MDYDKKVFWRYIFNEYFNLKKAVRTTIFYRYLIIISLPMIVFFTKFPLEKKILFTIIFVLTLAFLDFYDIYKSGEHRYWNRKRYGILSKSDIRKMRYSEKKLEKDENLNKEKEVL